MVPMGAASPVHLLHEDGNSGRPISRRDVLDLTRHVRGVTAQPRGRPPTLLPRSSSFAPDWFIHKQHKFIREAGMVQ